MNNQNTHIASIKLIIRKYFLFFTKFSCVIILVVCNSNCFAQWDDITPLNGLYNKVLFINQDTGFVIANYGLIIKTYDFGLTWDVVSQNNGYNYKDICFNNNLCFILGSNENLNSQIFIKSADYGQSWDTIVLPNNHGESFLFINDSTALIVGDNILRTTDYCNSFESVMEFSNIGAFYGGLLSIAFVNDSVGFASGIKRAN
ncbi:MAG: hypothetical protein KBB11_00005 [Bacteroidales bacterium]|nr:hypothetical protein [Bacteroidales bacterium]HOY39449.1 YCF48-related protein [Bacteroidales bacterium]